MQSLDKLISSDIKVNKGFKNHALVALIISRLGKEYLFNLCLILFLQIYTSQNSNYDKEHVLVSVSIKLGKLLVNSFINLLKDEYKKKIRLSLYFIVSSKTYEVKKILIYLKI